MPKFTFRQFQKEDLARAAMRDGAIIAWDTGLGKTVAALAFPMIKRARRCLLVVPEDLHQQFREEAMAKFGLTLLPLNDQNQFYNWRLNRPVSAANQRTQFFITTYHALGANGGDEWNLDPEKTNGLPLANATLDKARRAWCKANGVKYSPFLYAGVGTEKNGITCIVQPTLARLIQAHDAFDCVVIDEGVKIQGNTSHIGQGVRLLNPRFRLVLTATPIKNRLESFFWLGWWAAGAPAFGSARWPYPGTSEAREQFANQHLMHDKFVTREQRKKAETGRKPTISRRTARLTNIHHLWRVLAPIVIRRRKDDCGEDIVPKILHPIRVQPGKVQLAVYDHWLAHRPQVSKTANARAEAGVQLNFLRQAALCPQSPSFDLPGGMKSTTDMTPKMAAILSLVIDALEAGEQIIIGSPFTAFNEALHRRLQQAKVSCRLLDGSVSPLKRGEHSAEFKDRGYAVMVAGLNAMGEGKSFECCSRIVLPSIDWAFDANKQFVDRIWRLTSTRPVHIYIMAMEDSIDVQLNELWQEKSDASQLALDGVLLEEEVEEVSAELLLRRAIDRFNPRAATIDENELLAQWPQTALRLWQAHNVWRAGRQAVAA